MRMMVVAADGADSRYLQKALIESAHSLECIDDMRDAVFVAANERFDAVILHMSVLTSGDSIADAARALARSVQGATFVVIADIPEPTMRSEMLWIGVDACFPRHFSFLELHERIRRLHALRHSAPASAIPAATPLATAVDPLHLDARARTAVQGERRVLLTRHEFLLLECLMRAKDTAIARTDITRYAWPDKDEINPASVNLVISRLRKKLEAQRFDVAIETVAGVGYRLGTAAAPARR